MSDWLGLGLIVFVLLCGLYGMSRLGRRYEVTPEEFERRAEEARTGATAGAAAGLHALQKLMNPRAAEAVEVLKDLRAGYYDDVEEPGEGDGPGVGLGQPEQDGARDQPSREAAPGRSTQGAIPGPSNEVVTLNPTASEEEEDA